MISPAAVTLPVGQVQASSPNPATRPFWTVGVAQTRARPHQTATIRAGNGRNVIYADDTVNYVWTGTNPGTIVHAHVSGVSGVIHCGSSRQVIFLSHVSEKHFQLHGCGRISHYSVGY